MSRELYKVSWKFPHQTSERGNFMCQNLSELMQVLWNSEGISADNVDFLFVHLIKGNGNVIEVVAVDEVTRKNKEDPKVVDLVQHRLDKIQAEEKEEAKKAEPKHLYNAALGMYPVYEAIHVR